MTQALGIIRLALGIIRLDDSGESQVFVATRNVRNSHHSNGTIEAGECVFFRRDENGTLSLQYASDGRPTDGNQYVEFPSVGDADRFAEAYGLVPDMMAIDLPNLRGENYMLTTDHAASSHGIPVLVGPDRTAYGPADALPGLPEITAGDAVRNYRRWARDMMSDAQWSVTERYLGE